MVERSLCTNFPFEIARGPGFDTQQLHVRSSFFFSHFPLSFSLFGFSKRFWLFPHASARKKPEFRIFARATVEQVIKYMEMLLRTRYVSDLNAISAY